MIKKLLDQPLWRFLIMAFALYFVWFAAYELYINKYTGIDRWMAINLVHLSEGFLNILGYATFSTTDTAEVTIGVVGSQGNGVWIGEPCNGMTLFSLFAIFIIAYPGPARHKLWYIPGGILLIHMINVVRVSALALVEKSAPETLDFNHNYTFTIVVYGFVFLLWYIWTTKFALSFKDLSREKTDDKA